MFRIILTSKPNFENYSIEAGLHDGIKHFDHHKEFAGNPSPANNSAILPIVAPFPEGVNVEIENTHIDADTFIGNLRLLGRELPKIDLSLLEQIDLNGSSVCSDKFNPTLLFIVGIGQLARDLKFPRVTEDRQNVTAIIEQMIEKSDEEIIAIGRVAQEKSETAYEKCMLDYKNGVVLFSIGSSDPLEPSRAYEDGHKVVVVYRSHYKSISIYCSPSSSYAFGGKTVAGITFAGHSKSCGSPRGQEMTYLQAQEVFDAINL